MRTALDLIGGQPAVVADVGTGSGALAVAIAAGAPGARVWATDPSAEAVALARENVGRHGLADRVTVRQGNLLEPVPASLDLVVANLPYLPAWERPRHLDLAGEPPAAVFAEHDGLGPYRGLLDASGERLAAGGAVVLQFRRGVLAAPRAELNSLRARLEDTARLARLAA